jgi:hypothetical protein
MVIVLNMDVKIRFSSKIPESPKLTISNLPHLIGSCGYSFQRGALIFGQAALIFWVISGANSLVPYITHGELIHVPCGNEGQGFGWSNNNHRLLRTLTAKFKFKGLARM